MKDIDRKYVIRATNPCSGSIHDEKDSVLFLAKDKALPAALKAYIEECKKLGCTATHIESVNLLLARVLNYQKENELRVPDTDLPCEVDRCINGKGVT